MLQNRIAQADDMGAQLTGSIKVFIYTCMCIYICIYLKDDKMMKLGLEVYQGQSVETERHTGDDGGRTEDREGNYDYDLLHVGQTGM